jgi:hypothetical protein
MIKRKTKTERLLAFLKNGGSITEGQAKTRFGIANMDAMASNLRFKGYPVYRNRKTFNSGHTAPVFRLGTPTRRVIAAGYRALADGLVK